MGEQLNTILLVCQHALGEALRSRSQHNEESRLWAAKTMTNGAGSLPNLTMDHVAWIVLISSLRTTTGRFALTYSHDLDQAITLRDQDLLHSLSRGDRSMFVELYGSWDRSNLDLALDSQQWDMVDRTVNQELNTMMNALEELVSSYANAYSSGRPGWSKSSRQPKELGLYWPDSEAVISHPVPEPIYDRCHKRTCLAVKQPFFSPPPQVQPVFVVDKSNTERVPRIFSFNVVTLLRKLAQGNLNPYTEKPFSASTLSTLKQKYKIELVIYRRHLEILRQIQE
jgi:hypothetical protein